MSEISLLKWNSFPLSVSSQSVCPQVTDIAQAYWFACCYYLHKAEERVDKTGKFETRKNYNYFLNLVMEISFLTTPLQSKENFASVSGEQDAPPLQKSGRILISAHLRRKITEIFHMDAGGKIFLWLLLSPVVLACWIFNFLMVEVAWDTNPNSGIQMLPQITSQGTGNYPSYN